VTTWLRRPRRRIGHKAHKEFYFSQRISKTGIFFVILYDKKDLRVR
jgi:hypothetical protein